MLTNEEAIWLILIPCFIYSSFLASSTILVCLNAILPPHHLLHYIGFNHNRYACRSISKDFDHSSTHIELFFY